MNLVRGARYGSYALMLALLAVSCRDSPTGLDGGGGGPEPPPEDTVVDFSADLIAFESTRDGNADIFLMTTDGSAVVNVTNHPAQDGDPEWSPDGSKLAFATTRDGNTEIYVMNVDGSGLVRLTDNPAVDRFPAWSPDGSTIAFSRDTVFESTQDTVFGIFLMDADGSNQRRLTEYVGDVEPAWLGDGSRIVFCSDRSGNADIWSMNPDGTGLVNLTNDPTTFDCAPEVTTSTSVPGKISFVSDRAAGNLSIYTMNSDGSDLFRLTNDPAEDFDSSFSGDGATLAFDSNRNGNWDIYTVGESATNLRRLTDHAADEWNPVWRP
ncbi:MAG: hypothetical protein R3324_09725 [Halobacteriales archaeon]|nr:hypothetical protein [Halobacteriales archaeon]